MGPWRTLMSRARGRSRYFPFSVPSSSSSAALTFSSLSLAKAEQHQPCGFAPNGRFVCESPDACPRFSERIPGLGLGFTPKNGRENVEALFQDANDFLLDSSLKEGLGRLDFGLPEGLLQLFEQKRTWPVARASTAELAAGTLSCTKLWLNAGLSVKQNAPEQAEDVSLQKSMRRETPMQAPGCCGLEDFVIHADSVKRKRKKKMNKHKHRKLRRLARKSHK